MKKLYLLFSLFSVFFFVNNINAQPLSGVYTIDPMGQGPSNYTSFNNAVLALQQNGVAGPVIFQVSPQTFNEQITLTSITGTSSTNNISFIGSGINNTILNFAPTSTYGNYTLKFDTSGFVTFKKMTIKSSGTTYGSVINFSGPNNEITIDSCSIQTSTASTSNNFRLIYSTNAGNSANINITNNEMIGGESSIYLEGSSGADIMTLYVKDNRFSDFYTNGFYGNYISNCTVTSNYFETRSSTGGLAIGVSYREVSGASSITRNQIVMVNSGFNYGIKLYNCVASTSNYGIVANNFVACITSSSGSQYGIATDGASNYQFLNNSINMEGGGTGAAAMYHKNGAGADFVNNIFVNKGPGYSFYTYTPTAISQASHNCLYTGGTYLASWSSSLTDLASLQTASGKFANSYEYLPVFKTQTDLHINTLKLDGQGQSIANITEDFDGEPRSSTAPDIGADEFIPIPMDIGISSFDFPYGSVSPGSYDIKVSLSNFDTTDLNNAMILFQIDNNPIDTFLWTGNIAPGANASNIIIANKNFPAGIYHLKAWSEHPNQTYDNTLYNDTANFILYSCSPMSGNYTIGGTGADFSSFNQAVEMLNNCGVSGPVVFNVNTGVYNEKVILSIVAGASATNTITFRSTSGDSNDVVLQYSASGPQDASTLLLDSASYFTIKNMSIKGLSSTYGTAVSLINGSFRNKIEHSKLMVNGYGNLKSVVDIRSGNNIIEECDISSGTIGINVTGTQNKILPSIKISRNIIHNYELVGVYAEYADSLSVSKNKISSNSNNDTIAGMRLYKQFNLKDVSNNYIQLSSTMACYGISMEKCVSGGNNSQAYAPPGAAGPYSLPYDINYIFNNMISINGGNSSQGIEIYNCDSIQLFYNTVNISNTGSTSACLSSNGGASQYFLNNIFTNQGYGYAVYFTTNSQVNDFSYSCLKSNGILGYWNGNRNSISDLATASGKFTNCISETPIYMGTGDLHLLSNLSQPAYPVNGFTLDIDMETRDGVSPDMGADEFSKLHNDGALTNLNTTLPCAGTQTLSVYLRNDGLSNITTAELKCKYFGPFGPDSMIYQFNGNIAPNDSAYIIVDSTFQSIGGAGNTYDFFAAIKSINSVLDSNKTNDTVTLLNINYLNGPDINFNGVDSSYCENAPADTISAFPAGGTFSGNGIIGNTFHPSLIQTAPFSTPIAYTVTGTNGCTSTDTFWIQINPLPIVNITTPLKAVYCSYEQPVNLMGSPSGGTFMVNNSNVNVFNPSNAPLGTNTITYTYYDNFSCSATDTISINVAGQPTVSLPTQNDICSDTSAVMILGASPSGGIYMGPGVSPNSGLFYPIIAGAGLHPISYTYSDANGCSDTAYSSIKVFPTPTSNFSVPQSACLDDTIIVNYTGSAGPAATFNYFFDNATVISGSMGGPYELKWQNSGLKQITLSVSDSGCTSITNQQFISINSTPAIIFTPGSTNICYGDSITLFANQGPGYTYQWYDSSGIRTNDTLSQLVVHQSGVYSCLVSSPNGCPAMSNTITINIMPQIVADFSLPAQACLGDTVQINFTGNAPQTAVYNWNFDGGNVVSGSSQGPYSVVWNTANTHSPSLQISNGSCVSSIVQHSIQINAVTPNVTALGSTSFCDGGSVILMGANGPYTYQWYKNNQQIAGANQAFYTATQSGNYQLMVQDTLLGCSGTSQNISVTSNTTDFSLAFTANPTNFTSGPFTSNFTNQTPNKTSYYWNWNFGDGNTSSVIDPTHTYAYDGQYTVEVVAQDIVTGCYDTLTKTNYISCTGGSNNPCNITASITPAGYATICEGDSITLTATAGTNYTYQWYRNNILIPNSDSLVYVASQPGTYYVLISDSACSATSPPFLLSNYPNIKPVILGTGSLQPCTNDSMILSVNVSYASYSWNTGDSTASIYVNQTGYYQVSVTDNYGCTLTSAPYAVSNSFLNAPSICIVSVDSNDHNVVVWERQSGSLIDSFYIYREGLYAGIYDKIGAVPFNQTSIFVDTNSNPAVRSYRYRIAAVDTCGGVTLMSNYHKTMHLTINAGLNGAWNLIWEGYSGFNYSSYRIYRGPAGGNLSMIAQLPGSSTTFTDMYPPSGALEYQVEVLSPYNCYPDSIYNKSTTNYHTSRSNRANNTGIPPQYLTANFSANTQSGQWPIQVSFTDLSSGSPNSWLWNFGDGNTSIEQNPKHTYNNTGLYTVSLKVCHDDICDTVVRTNFIEVLPNGIVELKADISAEVYPNPNKGRFTLHIISASNEKLQLQVFSTIGKMIHSEELNVSGDVSKDIDLTHTPKGIYYLRLLSHDNMVLSRKIIIQ